MAGRFGAVGLVLATALAVAAAAVGEISTLSDDDFKQQVMGSNDMWLLSFETPECLACEDFVPQLQDVAASVAQWGIRVGSVDCTEHRRLCDDANVVAQPSFKFYASPSQRNPYTRKQYRVPIDYTGKLEGRSLERFILKSMHHSVVRIKAADAFTELFTKAKAAGLNVAVLFTQREQTSPLYKTASNLFTGRMEFAEVHTSATELVQQYEIDTIPTLGVVTTADNKFHTFAGDSKNLDEIKAFLTNLAATTAAKAPKQSSTQAISAAELPAHVENGRGAHILAITADGSTESIPNWDRISKKSSGSVHANVVQCDSDLTTSTAEVFALCEKLRNEGAYLLVVPFNSGRLTDFFSLDQADAALTAALESLPNKVVVISEANVDAFLLEAHAANKLAVLLVTDKETPTSFMKDIALTVQDHARTSMLVGASAEALARLQVRKVPAILCTFPVAAPTVNPDGTVGEAINIVPYAGRSDVGDVAAFVRLIYSQSRMANLQSDSTAPHPVPDAGAGATQPFEQVSVDNWGTLCPEGSSTVCAIAMVNGDGDSEAEAAVLANVMHSLGSSATTAFKFMWADATCLQTFADGFDVQPHKLPTVVAFSPLRLRSAQLIGAYDENNVKHFLEGVLRGSTATGPLAVRPEPDTTCAAQATDVEVTEELEDVDDLLEEIRREEEAEKQRLKQELDEERKRKAQEEEARQRAEASAKPKKPKKSSKKKKSGRKKNSEL